MFTCFGKLPLSVSYGHNGKHAFSQVGIMGSILMTKAVCWVTPSKVMVVRSFEVVAAYVLQVQSKYAEYLRSFDESGRQTCIKVFGAWDPKKIAWKCV